MSHAFVTVFNELHVPNSIYILIWIWMIQGSCVDMSANSTFIDIGGVAVKYWRFYLKTKLTIMWFTRKKWIWRTKYYYNAHIYVYVLKHLSGTLVMKTNKKLCNILLRKISLQTKHNLFLKTIFWIIVYFLIETPNYAK